MRTRSPYEWTVSIVPVARFRRVRGPGIVVISVLVTLALLGGTGTARSVPAGPTTVAAAVSGNGPCPGPQVGAGFAGTLAIEGGPLSTASTVGVALDVAYYQEVNVTYTVNDTPVSLNCVLVHVAAAAVTDGYGQFNGTIVATADSCGSEYCTFYSAPFGPVSVTPASLPPGYGLTSSGSGQHLRLTWVAGLSTVTLVPQGPAVPFAPGSTGSFTATPWMANGSLSPLSPEFHWTLNGTGWSFVAPSEGSTVQVQAGPEAGTGVLSVRANATLGNDSFETPTVAVNLTGVATTVENGSLGRTVVDVGEPDPVTVTAQGAAGYEYRATIDPGPGLSRESRNCTVTPRSSTVTEVLCSAVVTYSMPGTTELSVNVTNGFSNATWRSPSVTIDPAPVLRVSPSAPAGYPGVPISITLAVANGSGDPPYDVACFDPGNAPILCSSSSGPSWNFSPTYAAVGNFSAIAWVIDSAGTNRSVAVRVTIVDPISLGPLTLSDPGLEAGVPSNLSVVVSGGALPAAAWWNATDLARPIRVGPIGTDGTVSAVFVPPAVGSVTVTLTVRDALGETRGSSRSFLIAPGPLARMTALTPAAMPPTVVGRSVALAWQARDALGEPTPDVGSSVDLVVTNATGVPAPSWANVSGLGELSATPVSTFVVPTTAWNAGTLYLNLTPAVAGLLSVDLEGAGVSGSTVTVSVAAPDLLHLRLFDPEVRHAGNRINQTFWHVSDPAGDPVPGAYLTLAYTGPDGTSHTLLPVDWVAPGTTGAWVNYSLPASPDGSVRILDPAGEVLVGPISLGAASGAVLVGPPLALVAVPVALATGAASASFVARARWREIRVVPPDEEEEARKFAEGRAEVVELVRSAGTLDLATIATAWESEPPPADLEDWVRSLVADGTLLRSPEADGEGTYSVAPGLPESATPRVTLDAEVLARAVAARDAGVEETDEAPP